jgi:hypothetical protein
MRILVTVKQATKIRRMIRKGMHRLRLRPVSMP